MKTNLEIDTDLHIILQQVAPSNGATLVKNFKSGSDAMTLLVNQNDQLVVKKIVPNELAHRLRNQFLWLDRHKTHRHIVRTLGEYQSDTHYAIDIEYLPNTMTLFEYIHSRTPQESRAILDDVWGHMFNHVYKLQPIAVHNHHRDNYISDRLEKKLEHALTANQDLVAATKSNHIIINGKELDNYSSVMKRIKMNKDAWQDLATYRTSQAIHGDLTIDNILVDTSTNKPLLIDPSDDNQIQGPVLDFGRHLQSLMYGYEFLNADDTPVILAINDNKPMIDFHDPRSPQYLELHSHVTEKILPKYLETSELRAVPFHVGLFYGRLLAHRVTINPDNVLKYYGISIKALNDFINQYE